MMLQPPAGRCQRLETLETLSSDPPFITIKTHCFFSISSWLAGQAPLGMTVRMTRLRRKYYLPGFANELVMDLEPSKRGAS